MPRRLAPTRGDQVVARRTHICLQRIAADRVFRQLLVVVILGRFEFVAVAPNIDRASCWPEISSSGQDAISLIRISQIRIFESVRLVREVHQV